MSRTQAPPIERPRSGVRVRSSITWAHSPTAPAPIQLIMAAPCVAAGIFVVRMGLLEKAQPGEGLQGMNLVLVWVGALFGLAGMGMLATGVRGLFRGARIARLRRERPGEPWLWDHAWDTEGASDMTGLNARRAFVSAVAIVLFMVPFHIIAAKAPAGIIWKIGIGVFDLVALLLLLHAIYLTLRRARWGVSRPRFSRFPFAPGERLDAQLMLRDIGSGFDSLSLSLRCIQERYVRRGRNTTLERETLHEASQTMKPESDGPLTRPSYDISFPLPAEVPGTDLGGSPIRYWELEARGATGGVDYGATFRVPVYSRVLVS